MNCANVLCTKISKKGFLLHLNRVKLTNYMLHFVIKDPVGGVESSKSDAVIAHRDDSLSVSLPVLQLPVPQKNTSVAFSVYLA